MLQMERLYFDRVFIVFFLGGGVIFGDLFRLGGNDGGGFGNCLVFRVIVWCLIGCLVVLLIGTLGFVRFFLFLGVSLVV